MSLFVRFEGNRTGLRDAQSNAYLIVDGLATMVAKIGHEMGYVLKPYCPVSVPQVCEIVTDNRIAALSEQSGGYSENQEC